MNSFKIAFRKLFRKGEHTTTRIITLATGLAFGLILLAEVFYYYSFDSFYPDAQQIYEVNALAKLDKSSDELSNLRRVSGAIGPGLKAEVPGVEAATRFTHIGDLVFFTEENQSLQGKFVLADEFLHELMPREIIAGNKASEVLKTPMTCLISSEIAENMGNNAIGKIIELKDFPGKKLTIGGIFEKLPENSNHLFDIAISMPSIGNFIWDGSENWFGNDRYFTFVKLAKGVKPESLASAVRQMQEKHQNIKELEQKNGVTMSYTFEPLRDLFPNKSKEMIFILSAIAFIVLLVSIMNYILLTVSTLVNRSKTSAIFKCYGADKRDLHSMIFIESTLIFLISLFAAALLILIIRPFVENQVAHSLMAMFNVYVIVPILLILTIIIFLVSYFPGRLYAQTPVSEIFRNYRAKGMKWKKALIAIQFIGVALISSMLWTVGMQYQKMKNADHGYQVEGVYYSSTSGIDPHKINSLLHQLESLPEVAMVGLGNELPIYPASGNSVMSPDGDKELFNVADYYYVDENYFSILNIPIASGQGFQKGVSAPNDVMISKKGADLLILNNGWKDGVVGKSIEVTEHNGSGASTISGVFDDVVNQALNGNDVRPSVFFYAPQEWIFKVIEEYPNYTFFILIKTVPGQYANVMQKFTDILNSAIPRGEAKIYSLAAEQESNYQAEKGFKNALYMGSFVILAITIIGLLGYLNDEITCSRKSLAIRKINGATVADIVQIFVMDVAKIAIPCVLLGLVGGWYLAARWLNNFAQQIILHWYIFAIIGLIILLLISVVASINSLRAALQNPVKSLKYE